MLLKKITPPALTGHVMKSVSGLAPVKSSSKENYCEYKNVCTELICNIGMATTNRLTEYSVGGTSIVTNFSNRVFREKKNDKKHLFLE